MNHNETLIRRYKTRYKSMATLKALKTINRPGMFATPTRTLYLNIAAGGARSWVQRLTINSKRHHLGLGPVSAVSYSVASKAATVNLGKVYMGIDVVAERREAKRLAAVPTFEAMMADTFDALRSRWTSAKTANKWRSLLTNYAGPLMGKRVDRINTQDVLNVLLPIYKTAPGQREAMPSKYPGRDGDCRGSRIHQSQPGRGCNLWCSADASEAD